LLKGILVAEGFGVLQASDGPGALAIFEAEGESINLVILDMTMPGMKGEDVLNRLRKASKTMKVIISSGFMSEEQRDKLEEYGADGFLDKPYSDKDVINAVESVLSLQYVADLT
jgi:two-component system cell cycle sensor histidine kinase/response regulator CckA